MLVSLPAGLRPGGPQPGPSSCMRFFYNGREVTPRSPSDLVSVRGGGAQAWGHTELCGPEGGDVGPAQPPRWSVWGWMAGVDWVP